MQWYWYAPLIAVLAHIGEEFFYPGGFPEWDRQYRSRVRRSITRRFYFVINAALVGLCVSVVGGGAPGGVLHVGGVAFGSIVPPRFAGAAWLGLVALLAANALWHVVGTLRSGRISPGVRTGVLLYLPLAAFGVWHFLVGRRVSLGPAFLAMALGASYQFWDDILHRLRAGAGPPGTST